MADLDISGAHWSSDSVMANVRRRRRGELWLKAAGLIAISIAFVMLFILVASLVFTGFQAFTQTHVTLDVAVPGDVDPDDIDSANWRSITRDAVSGLFPEASDRELRDLGDILSSGAQYLIKAEVAENPDLIGTTFTLSVPVSDPYDQLSKGLISRDTPETQRRVDDAGIAAFDTLEAAGRISAPFNTALFVNPDSRFPELAGLRGALIGSFYALLTCFLISFPIGIGAAVYLEEFAPKNRLSDFIEININNLAAVPSVVFGLLALAVFLNLFGLPRGAPFVGGMTLALMTLPTIIIATRAALKAVPPSIREAALGVGASKQQVVFHHVLPLAAPGILTGTIIGLAQALGETAPLLLIGMNAFITASPSTPFDSATALPTQIYIWADSPERGFVSRTSAAILVLLGFLVIMNALAIFLRERLERRW
jgi:phosphate transport system permease protein